MVDRLLNGVLVQLKPAGHIAVFERNQRLVELLSAFARESFPSRRSKHGSRRAIESEYGALWWSDASLVRRCIDVHSRLLVCWHNHCRVF